MSLNADQIQTWFNRKPVSRDQVHAWEARRVTANLRKFDLPVRTGDLSERRHALAQAKLELGRASVESTLAREVGISDRLTGMLAQASRGRRRLSQVELFAPGVRAEELPAWYAGRNEADDEGAFLTATPDHHLFRPAEDAKSQEVWEKTGGSPLTSRFFIELDCVEGLVSLPDPTYPVQMSGCARLADGTVLGGIRHQFRDEPGGVRVLLTVEFPWLLGPFGPAAHRWHLASEFANWLEAASA